MDKKQPTRFSSYRKSGRSSIEQEREMVKNTFDIFDVDGSGTMDRDELNELMKQLCIPVSPEELQSCIQGV